jgi:hypothetical protein
LGGGVIKSTNHFKFLTTFLLVFLLHIVSAFSQNNSKISGSLTDIDSKPVAFVNLVLRRLADSSLIKLSVSRENGSFEFIGIAAGKYFVEGSMVGYSRFRSPNLEVKSGEELEAGTFMMSPSDVKLKEVNVTASKPFITVQPDKLVVNVDNNPLMINSNAMDVLKTSPGVMVNQDDQIFLQGKSGLLIYIDGRQSPLSEKDLANWLKTIPSGQIDVIEIITNPSAKYDAAGNAGIINIRLKKNQKRGMNGTLNSGVSTGLENENNYNKTNHSVNLNFGGKKVNVFATYGFDYAKSWSFMNFDRFQSERSFIQKTDNFDKRLGHNGKLGMDWTINKRHTISVMGDANLTDNTLKAFSGNYISNIGDSQPFSLLEASNFGKKTNNTGNLNVNHSYKDSSGLEVSTDGNFGYYFLANETDQPNFYRNFLPESSTVDKSFGLNTPVDISIWTLKTDVEKKIKKSVLSFGYKFSNVLTDNEFTLFNRIGGVNEKDLNQSSKFSYLERVGAGYTSFRHIFNDKWSVLGGLRYEHTYSIGDLKTELGVDSLVKREYGSFFPSAGVTYNLDKKHSFSFNYSRRVDRPVYRFLNPFQYRLDELSFEQGNPFLNPQFTNNFQLSHTFMSMVSSSLGYSHTTDFFARVIDSSGNRTFLTRRNLADVKTISFNLSSPIPIRNWWNGFLNFTFNHQDYEADFGEGKILKLPVDFYSIYMQHSFSLPEKISLQVSGSYSSPNVWGGTFRNRAFWFVEAGISKKVLKGKGTLSLNITDIFLSQRWQGRSNFGGIDITARGGNDSRLVKLGFTMNFGDKDFKPSRRKIGNQEERQRLRGE